MTQLGLLSGFNHLEILNLLNCNTNEGGKTSMKSLLKSLRLEKEGYKRTKKLENSFLYSSNSWL